MARLQILELPEGTGDDRPPFILVIDEVPHDNPVYERFIEDLELTNRLANRVGARAVLVFEDTIDIPANDTSAFAQPPVALHLDDLEVRGAIAADMNKARERARVATIGQHLAEERTDIARDMDRLANHKAAITDALGMDRLRDWDDIRNAARGLRRERDAQAETLERIRRLPEEPQSMEPQHHGANGYGPGYRAGIRDAKNVTYPQTAGESSSEKQRKWCCSLAFQTLGRQHNDDCTEEATR
ncbi:hypothetical protein RB201_04130 [Streptomyces sp. S1A(2023)]